MNRTLAVVFLCAMAMPAAAQPARLAGEARRTLERCDDAAELARRQQWDDALAAYLKIVDDAGDDLIPVDAEQRQWRPARQAVTDRIAAAPQLIERYRSRFEADASRTLADARTRRDVAALTRLADERGATAAAIEAWDVLGDLAFERGEFAVARRAWRRVGNSPLTQAKIILAGRFLGEPQEVALMEFRQKHAAALGHLAGRDGPLADILDAVCRDPATVIRLPAALLPTGAPDTVLPTITLRSEEEPEPPARPLAYHPLVWQGHAVVCDGSRVTAFDIKTGRTADIFDVARSLRGGMAARPHRPTALTADARRVYARLTAGSASYLVALEVQPGGEAMRWKQTWSLLADRVVEPGAGTASLAGVPIVADGKLYTAWMRTNGNRATLGVACYRTDAADAGPLWRREVAEATHEPDQRHARGGTLALAGSHVIHVTDAGSIVALDAATGRRVWAYRYPPRATKHVAADLMPVPREHAACVAADGQLFVAPADCAELFALDAFTGEPLWPRPQTLEVAHLLGVAGQRLVVTADGMLRGVVTVNVATGLIDPSWGSLATERPAGRGLLRDDGLLWPTRSRGLLPLRFDERPVAIPTAFFTLPGGNLAYADNCLLVATAAELHILRWNKPPQPPPPVKPRDNVPRDAVRVLPQSPAPVIADLKPRWTRELPTDERPLLVETSSLLSAGARAAVWRHLPSGELRWKTSLAFEPAWAVATEPGYAVAGTDGAALLDRVTGKAAWSWSADEPLAGFAAADGKLFVTADRRQAIALELADGVPVWRRSVAPEETHQLHLMDAKLLLHTSGGRARLFDAATGRWRTSLPTTTTAWRSPPLRTPDGALVFAAPGDRLTAIDAASGEPLWTADVGRETDSDGTPLAPFWLGDSPWVLASTTVGGVIRRLDPRTGRVAAGDPGLPPLRGLNHPHSVARREEALVVAAEDRLVGFDANTGRRRWSLTLPARGDWRVLPAHSLRWLVYTDAAAWRWAEPPGGYLWTALLVDDRDGKEVGRYELPARQPGVITGGDAKTWIVAAAGQVVEFESTGEAK